jgi:AcrR family transcriptional regulator
LIDRQKEARLSTQPTGWLMMAESGDLDSRARIASAALTEFAEFGVDGARIARIAERARVNKQLLYYYFGSKNGLYDSVVGHVAVTLDGLSRSRIGSDSPIDRIRDRLRAVSDHLDLHPEQAAIVLTAVSEQQPRTGPIRAAVKELAARIKKEISAAQGMGHFRDDVDPEMAAAQAVTLLLGRFSLESVLDLGGDEESPGDWIQSAGDLLVRSFSW